MKASTIGLSNGVRIVVMRHIPFIQRITYRLLCMTRIELVEAFALLLILNPDELDSLERGNYRIQ